MDGFAERWWVAGGWAIEMFSGVSREHADIDISVLLRDLEQFCDHVGRRVDVWAADSGSVTPLSAASRSHREPDLFEPVVAREWF